MRDRTAEGYHRFSFPSQHLKENTMPQESSQWKVGDVLLNLYQVLDTLGEGGFGKVYKVRHPGWNIDLAVKIPKPEIVAAAGGVENFEREAETWVNLGLHPHIVSCYYVRRIESSPLVFAEYVTGGSLHDWIDSRQLYDGGKAVSLKRILDIAIQFAWGLHHAHEQGLIHQDVKPENVMMTPGGVVKVTDFGLANAKTMAAIFNQAAGENSTLIVKGSGAMTPAYCSPEQANRETLTRRTDLWSWGLCVLEMFQGERTWGVGSAAAMALEDYLQNQPEDSDLPEMQESVAQLLRRCFRENPSERPRTMLDVANELKDIYQQVTGELYPRLELDAAKEIADRLNNRAVSLLDLGKQKEALQLWEQALQVQPYHLESTYNRGLILWRSAKINDDALVAEMNKTRADRVGDWLDDYLLSLVHVERDDCEAAIKTLESIHATQAESEEVQLLLREARDRLPQSQRLLRTFEEHAGEVTSVALSADDRFALSGSKDKTLKLWEVGTGQCLRNFEGHRGEVTSVSLSADGRLALSGSSDGTVKLWEVATGQCLRTFEGRVTSLSLSADGRFAIAGWDFSQIKVWDVATGQCLRALDLGIDISSVSLSADGQFALYGGKEDIDQGRGFLELLEVATGRSLWGGYEDTDWVRSVSLSADGQFALYGGKNGKLRLLEVPTGYPKQTFKTYQEAIVYAACLSADGRYVLSKSYEGGNLDLLKLWEVATGRCLRTFQVKRSMSSVSLSSDGRFALLGSGVRLELWAVNDDTNSYAAPMQLCRVVATETVVSVDQTYQRELEQGQIALAQGDYLAAARHIRKARSQSGYHRSPEAINAWVKLYTCLPRKAFIGVWEGSIFEGHTDWVLSVSLSVDKRFALSGGGGANLIRWEVATGRCLRTFEGHQNFRHPYWDDVMVHSVSLSADSQFALSGGWDKTLKLWEVATGQCLRTFEGHTGDVTSVSLSADSQLALSASYDKTLKLWEVATGRCLRTFEGHTNKVKSVSLSADCQFAISGSDDKTLKLWEVATGRCLHTFEGHTEPVNSVSLSADCQFAISGSDDKTLKLWEVVTGRCLRTFEGHTHKVNSVSLSADGQFAFSGSGSFGNDTTVKLWEVVTGKCLRTFEEHKKGVTSISLSADGQIALSGSYDKTLKLWFLDWELENRQRADWDEGARPHLQNFLTLHTPYAAALPQDREPTEEEITLTLTRRGTPTWTEQDFQNLLYTLGCAGYGWLRPEGVRQQLEAMAATWQAPPPLGENAVVDKADLTPLTPFPYQGRGELNSPLLAGEGLGERSVQPNLTPLPDEARWEVDAPFLAEEGLGEKSIAQTKVQSSLTTQQQLMPTKVVLTVIEGSLKGQKFEFDSRTTCIIGRAKDCNPQLPNDQEHITISRYHCLLDINPPDIRVRDFGSLNGTFVNNQKIGQRQAEQTPEEAAQIKFPEYDLKNGDEIKLGNTIFQVGIEVLKESEALGLVSVAISTQTIESLQSQQHLIPQVNPANPNLLAIEGYTTLKQLGKGGMGEVYLVRNNNTGEEVALKVMLPKVAAKPYAVERFLREVENTKALNHPNVVQLKESGYYNDTFFFTLEYCNGGSVADLMCQRNGRLSVDEAIPIILQVLDGLEYAHNAEISVVNKRDGSISKGQGLVHRDLKPHNIFLVNTDSIPIAKIGDYGLAKAFDFAGLSGQTMTGSSAGTPHFMPRQQVINFKYAKPEVDVWAAAACLYNMLTGKFPRDFINKDPFLVVLQTNAVPISERNIFIPKPLAELIDLALIDNPTIEFKNAAAFKQALLSVL